MQFPTLAAICCDSDSSENELFILLEYWQSQNVAVDASSLLAKFRFPQMTPSFVADVVRKSSLCDPTKRYHAYLDALIDVAERYHKMSRDDRKSKSKLDGESNECLCGCMCGWVWCVWAGG